MGLVRIKPATHELVRSKPIGVFLNKANLSEQVYCEELQPKLVQFGRDKCEQDADYLFMVCDDEPWNFALLFIDEDDEVHSNLSCLKKLKELFGAEYRQQI